MKGETSDIGRPTSDQALAGHRGNDDGMPAHGDDGAVLAGSPPRPPRVVVGGTFGRPRVEPTEDHLSPGAREIARHRHVARLLRVEPLDLG
jgi:hypothetical protein